jgi:hypothetical protein
MSEATSSKLSEILEHLGYMIRLSPTDAEWMAVVARPKQRPALIVAAGRQTVIEKAHQWIEAQPRIGAERR